MGFFETKEFWAAVIQSVAAVIAVGVAARVAFRAIPASELRRQRLSCISQLVASRYLLAYHGQERGNLSFSDKAAFLSAINAVPAFFGGDAEVMLRLRDFRRLDGDEKNAALMSLIRAMARVADLPLNHVEDADLSQPFRT